MEISLAACRSSAAERMRLYRKRRRVGLRWLPIELRETDIDKLISKGYLDAVMRNEAGAIIQALYDYLDRDA
jgi:hypothetical protein